MLDDRISAAIARIYDGAHDSAAWDRAMIELVSLTRSAHALVSPTDIDSGAVYNCSFYGSDEARLLDGVRDYGETMHRIDPVLRFGMENPQGRVVTLSRAMARAPEGDDPFVRWFRSEIGAEDYVVRYTPRVGSLAFAVALVPSEPSHEPRDLELFGLLFAHIEQALRVAALPPALEASDEPIMLLDWRGRVSTMSPAAADLLAGGDGLAVADGELRAAGRGDQERLDAAIRSALDALAEGGAGADLALARPSGRRPLLVRVGPLPHPHPVFEMLRPAAIVRIVDPDTSVSGGDSWASLFGLTPAEIRLAATLLAGEGNLRTTADMLGIAYATARVQLASLFDKTGVRSQVQLARLLTRLGG